MVCAYNVEKKLQNITKFIPYGNVIPGRGPPRMIQFIAWRGIFNGLIIPGHMLLSDNVTKTHDGTPLPRVFWSHFEMINPNYDISVYNNIFISYCEIFSFYHQNVTLLRGCS